ncbi:hypothetical protein CSPX01_07012 [Colletotrichum filicis]|nr:hypothetical protein CSPX01_07012 [Colletotrichum filicis]
MNTSDSIHLQAARRTPREDLELYFSDGACRHSLALTHNIYFTVSYHFLYPHCENQPSSLGAH